MLSFCVIIYWVELWHWTIFHSNSPSQASFCIKNVIIFLCVLIKQKRLHRWFLNLHLFPTSWRHPEQHITINTNNMSAQSSAITTKPPSQKEFIKESSLKYDSCRNRNIRKPCTIISAPHNPEITRKFDLFIYLLIYFDHDFDAWAAIFGHGGVVEPYRGCFSFMAVGAIWVVRLLFWTNCYFWILLKYGNILYLMSFNLSLYSKRQQYSLPLLKCDTKHLVILSYI